MCSLDDGRILLRCTDREKMLLAASFDGKECRVTDVTPSQEALQDSMGAQHWLFSIPHSSCAALCFNCRPDSGRFTVYDVDKKISPLMKEYQLLTTLSDGSLLVVRNETLILMNPNDGRVLRSFPVPITSKVVTDVVELPKERICIFDMMMYSQVAIISYGRPPPKTKGKPELLPKELAFYEGMIRYVGCDENGHDLLIWSSHSSSIEVYDVQANAFRHSLEPPGKWNRCGWADVVLPENAEVYTVYSHPNTRDCVLCVWNCATGQRIRQFHMQGVKSVDCMCWMKTAIAPLSSSSSTLKSSSSSARWRRPSSSPTSRTLAQTHQCTLSLAIVAIVEMSTRLTLCLLYSNNECNRLQY